MESHPFVIELSVAEAIERAAALAAGGRALLGIAGCPGAGKSTLSAAITAEVASTVVVPMDGFHMLNEDLVRLERRNRKGAPDTFDVAGFVALLRLVRGQSAGEIVTAPRYDRAASAPVPDAISVDARRCVGDHRGELPPARSPRRGTRCVRCWTRCGSSTSMMLFGYRD